MCVAASHIRMHSAMFSLARAFCLSSPGAAAFAGGIGAAGGGAPACASTAPAPRTSDSNVIPTIRMNVLEPPSQPRTRLRQRLDRCRGQTMAPRLIAHRRRPKSLLGEASPRLRRPFVGRYQSMKAMLSKRVGGPETLVLEELPDPKPGAGEVLLAIKACGVNYPDLLIIEDRYQFKPERPFAPGGEVAGVVEAVGAGVTQFKPGDRVIGSSIAGGMAEKLVLEADRCIAMPDAMPFDEASALVLTYGTSIYALKDRAKLKKGETLLVLGAAGGVGLSAVELGKAYGARVIAAVSSEEKLAFAKKHGAESGVVYPPGPFDKAGTKALADLFKNA